MSDLDSTSRVGNRTHWRRRFLVVAVAWLGATLAPISTVVPSVTQAEDTTAYAIELDSVAVEVRSDSVTVPPATVPLFFHSAFDTIPQRGYLLSHAFSLDHFMEFESGFVLRRLGPIGKSATISRHGFGRGRATVYVDGIPINDPQNDVAPIAHFPASAIGVLVTGSSLTNATPAADGIEGGLQIVESPPPENRPNTFIEVSKGTRNLRQRRVRFSSQRSGFGLDLGYDELLNDGYSFDARQLSTDQFVSGLDYGKSRSRHYTMNLRGALPAGEEFVFSFRRFTSNSDGDLTSTLREQRFSGYLAAITASLRRLKLTFFERGYKTNCPDSNTSNQTTAGYVEWQALQSQERRVTIGAGFEDIAGVETIAGFRANPRLRKSAARIEAVSELRMGVVGRAQISGTDYRGLSTGWGGSLSVGRRLGRHSASLEVRRGYRMPNLGELFLPAHTVGGGVITFAGNRYVKNEFTWETGGRVSLRWKGITNELRLTAVQVEDPILFVPGQTAETANWRIAANGI